MPSYPEICIQACRRRGVVLDTNVFILFLVGCWNPKLLISGGIKRLKSGAYSAADFQRLLYLLGPFQKRVVTPSILTEVCHLLEDDDSNYKGAIFRSLSQMLNNLTESQKPSKLLATLPAFFQFGLADASVADLASRGYFIITEDLNLQNFIQKSGSYALNFTQIRAANWL